LRITSLPVRLILLCKPRLFVNFFQPTFPFSTKLETSIEAIMAEGAQLPWKIQKLNLAPTLSYDSIHKPLQAPKGKCWNYDPLHKEWSLVATEKPQSSRIFVDAVVISEDEDGTPVTKEILVDHYIMPSDTFQGICLRYKIKPLQLRRANGGFTGENLNLVPNPLKIPLKDCMIPTADAEGVDGSAQPLTRSQVVGVFLDECRGASRSEARAYLMMNDWDLAAALENAQEDGF
jgi:hypothetical protein